MNARWVARALVVALHAAVLLALWLHRAPRPEPPAERRWTSVRLIAPARPPATPAPRAATAAPRPPAATRAEARPADTPEDLPAPAAATTPPPPAVTAPPPEPPRTALRLTLPPGYAASSAAARNPALGDPRSNTARPTLEDRIADATAGGWAEERTSDNRAQAVGALGDRRTVMRRGDTCVEIFRSRIADSDPFNGNVAPLAIGMMGKPYKCK